MRKVTPYLANGRPKPRWGCGNPFVVRDGHAEAILPPDMAVATAASHRVAFFRSSACHLLD